jgi:hypothetical protein
MIDEKISIKVVNDATQEEAKLALMLLLYKLLSKPVIRLIDWN